MLPFVKRYSLRKENTAGQIDYFTLNLCYLFALLMVRAGPGQRNRDQQDPVAALAEIYWHCCPAGLRSGGWKLTLTLGQKESHGEKVDLDKQ